MIWLLLAIVALVVAVALAGLYLGLVTGAVPVDLGVGRRTRRLGPQVVEIAAPREVVFDVISAPYLERQPRASAEKIHVLERGTDMVLAAHRTPIRGELVATTVETVRFTRPERVDFRLVRGPVPHVVEQFLLTEQNDTTTHFEYHGELGSDLWGLGSWWASRVSRMWERTVESSVETIKAEAERRYAASPPTSP